MLRNSAKPWLFEFFAEPRALAGSAARLDRRPGNCRSRRETFCQTDDQRSLGSGFFEARTTKDPTVAGRLVIIKACTDEQGSRFRSFNAIPGLRIQGFIRHPPVLAYAVDGCPPLVSDFSPPAELSGN